MELGQQHRAGEVEPGPLEQRRRQVDPVEARAAQSEKLLPTSLQPSSVASKNDVRRKSQPTKAVAVCLEALKRPPWKVHRSNTAPDVLASDRSTSVKVQSTNRAAPRPSPYQSSLRKC